MQTIMNSPATAEQGATMRAVTQETYGGPDLLRLTTTARPDPAADEVLIEVVAAGVDRGVWHLMTGLPYVVRLAGYGLRRPKQPVLGMDVAGRVAAVGSDVTRFAVGDEVFGIGIGTFAEYAVAQESKLVHKPANIGFEEAAVSAISGITALQALTTVGRVESGQEVLVLGASGGVGSFAVQLAKAMGATVNGVASGPKLDAVRDMGADHVIDYGAETIDHRGRRFDLIIDTGGRNPLPRLRRAMKPSGTLVIVGGEDGNRITGGFGRQLRALMISPFVGERLTMVVSKESADDIERLAAYLATGAVTPVIGQRFDLDDVAIAMRAMEAGTLTGKTVVSVRG